MWQGVLNDTCTAHGPSVNLLFVDLLACRPVGEVRIFVAEKSVGSEGWRTPEMPRLRTGVPNAA